MVRDMAGRSDRAAATANRLAAAFIGCGALLVGLYGTLTIFSSFRAVSVFSILDLSVGLIAVGAAVLGFVAGLLIWRRPGMGRLVGSLAADRLAAVLIGLAALATGYVGVRGLFSCSSGVDLCIIGVLLGYFMLVIAVVGLGLGLAIWKQPRIARPIGLLATAVASGGLGRLAFQASLNDSTDFGEVIQVGVVAFALGAAFILLTYSTLEWLRSMRGVE